MSLKGTKTEKNILTFFAGESQAKNRYTFFAKQAKKEGYEQIAAVLEKNTDIDVMVEGHTDNVPLKGKNQVKDNWDLSVMRATSITKIILEGSKINPNRIIPCGRGEYSPQVKNTTAENRAKNRRTEIILSPKVNELMEILK